MVDRTTMGFRRTIPYIIVAQLLIFSSFPKLSRGNEDSETSTVTVDIPTDLTEDISTSTMEVPVLSEEWTECKLYTEKFFPVNSTNIVPHLCDLNKKINDFRFQDDKAVKQAILVLGTAHTDQFHILQHIWKSYKIDKVMEAVKVEGYPQLVTMDPNLPFESESNLIPLVSNLITVNYSSGVSKTLVALSPIIDFPSEEAEFVSKYFLVKTLSVADALKVFITVPWRALNVSEETYISTEFDRVIESVSNLFLNEPEKLKRVGFIIDGAPITISIYDYESQPSTMRDVSLYLERYRREMALENGELSKSKAKLVSLILGNTFIEQDEIYEDEYYYSNEKEQPDQLKIAILSEQETCGESSLSGKFSEVADILQDEDKMLLFERNLFRKELKHITRNLYHNKDNFLNDSSLKAIHDKEFAAGGLVDLVAIEYLAKARKRCDHKATQCLADYGRILDMIEEVKSSDIIQTEENAVVKMMKGLHSILEMNSDANDMGGTDITWETLLEAQCYLSILRFVDAIEEVKEKRFTLSNILEIVMGHYETFIGSNATVHIHCDEEEKIVVITGDIVKFSDFIPFSTGFDRRETILSEKYDQKLERILVIASDKVFFDRDIKRPGLIVSVIGGTWEIIGHRSVNLDGLNANKHIIPRALAALERGGVGTDGLPGKPGGNGGAFISALRVLNKTPNSSLTISASAGNGGPGQNGGHGGTGQRGRNATFEDFPPPETFKNLRIPPEYLIPKDFYFTNDFRHGPSYVTKPGGIGGVGGKGGRGGAGGSPGKMGIIKILRFEYKSPTDVKLVPLSPPEYHLIGSQIINYGLEGINGKPGRPGKGGRNGYPFRCSLLNETTIPQWRVCGQHIENIDKLGRGNPGPITPTYQLNYNCKQEPKPQVDYRKIIPEFGIISFRDYLDHERNVEELFNGAFD